MILNRYFLFSCLAFTALGLLNTPAALAQSTLFKCTDDKGITHYGETMPAACAKKDITEMSKQGRTVRKLDAPLTPEQLKTRADEAQKKAVEDQKIADQGLYNKQYNADSTHIVKNIIEKKGAELNIWYDRDFNQWVVLQYRIDVSSNYAESILKNGTVNGFFITQIRVFKDLYLSHRAIVRGNLGQKPFKPQFSQVVTLSYGKTF